VLSPKARQRFLTDAAIYSVLDFAWEGENTPADDYLGLAIWSTDAPFEPDWFPWNRTSPPRMPYISTWNIPPVFHKLGRQGNSSRNQDPADDGSPVVEMRFGPFGVLGEACGGLSGNKHIHCDWNPCAAARTVCSIARLVSDWVQPATRPYTHSRSGRPVAFGSSMLALRS